MTDRDPDPAGGVRRSTHLVVVGASGWLGAAVSAASVRRGVPSTGVSARAPADVEGTVPGLADLLGPGSVVVNAAGLTSGTPEQLYLANVVLCEALARHCEQAGVPLLTIGSAAEYGVPREPEVAESHVEDPTSDYGRSKLEATQLLRARSGLRSTVARVFNLVGPGRRSRDPVQDFALQVRELPAEGGTVRAWDASLVRDYSSLGWTAERLVDLALVAGCAPTVNVCSGQGTSFHDLIVAMARTRNRPVRVVSTDPGGLPRVVGDPTLLRSLVPVPPPAPLEELARLALQEA